MRLLQKNWLANEVSRGLEAVGGVVVEAETLTGQKQTCTTRASNATTIATSHTAVDSRPEATGGGRESSTMGGVDTLTVRFRLVGSSLVSCKNSRYDESLVSSWRLVS